MLDLGFIICKLSWVCLLNCVYFTTSLVVSDVAWIPFSLESVMNFNGNFTHIFVVVYACLILDILELPSQLMLWLSSPTEQSKSMTINANLFKDYGEYFKMCL